MRHVVVPRTAIDVPFVHVREHIRVFAGALENALSVHGSMHLDALVVEEKRRPAVFPSPTSPVATNGTHHTSNIRWNESVEMALIL